MTFQYSTLTSAEREKRHETGDTRADVDALGDHRCEQRHEAERHRQAIPHERVIVRIPVIVGGTERCERNTGEENEIWPAFDGYEEAVRIIEIVAAKNEAHSHDAEDEE